MSIQFAPGDVPPEHLSLVRDAFKEAHREHFPDHEAMRDGFIDAQLNMQAAVLLKEVRPNQVCHAIRERMRSLAEEGAEPPDKITFVAGLLGRRFGKSFAIPAGEAREPRHMRPSPECSQMVSVADSKRVRAIVRDHGFGHLTQDDKWRWYAYTRVGVARLSGSPPATLDPTGKWRDDDLDEMVRRHVPPPRNARAA